MSNLELRGEIAGLKQMNERLDIKANTTFRAIRFLLSRAGVSQPVEETDVEGMASLIADLIEIKGEKVRNLGTMKRIEKELA
jgi:hypothetical protein